MGTEETSSGHGDLTGQTQAEVLVEDNVMDDASTITLADPTILIDVTSQNANFL